MAVALQPTISIAPRPYVTDAHTHARCVPPIPSRSARGPPASGTPQQRVTYLRPPRRCSGGSGCGGRTLGGPSKGGERVGAPPCARRRSHGHRVQRYRREKKAAPGGGCTKRVRGGRHSQGVARILHKPLRQEDVSRVLTANGRQVPGKTNETQKRGREDTGHRREDWPGTTDWTSFAHNFAWHKEKLGT